MSILSSQSIWRLCKSDKPLITPSQVRTENKGYSGGLSPAGYDIHIAESLTLYPLTLKNIVCNSLGLARASFALASTIEQFNIPDNIMAFVLDKSSWARQGLALQTTCLEPNWCGFLTLELSNHGKKVLHIVRGTPIAQIVFHHLDVATDLIYTGKYQNQKSGPQPAIVTYKV